MGIGTGEAIRSSPTKATGGAWPARARAYVSLTRPGVSLMVALTAPPAVLMGHAATAATHGLLAAVAGTLLLSSGCSAVNAWYERDRDALMSRTARRPLPAGDLAAGEALTFGLVTAVLGILVLAAWGSALGALLGALTFAYYLGIYTVWLKPRSAHSTVAGAVAGAAAPLIADAAAHGRIGPWGWTVFAIIFLWQPAHVWAIALFRKNEFAAAGLPMMPAIVGETATRRLMLGWTLPLLPVSLLPWLGGVLGPVYAVTALAVGAMFVATIAQAMRARDARSDRRVFKVSLIYLMAVFGAMLAELALR